MRPPDEINAAIEHELAVAELDLTRGLPHEARKHLDNAKRLGASKKDVMILNKNILQATYALNKHSRLSGAVSFCFTAACCSILALQQPRQWTYTIWILALFLIIPLCSGFIFGRLQGAETTPAQRFRKALRMTFIPVFIYSGWTLFYLRSQFSSMDFSAFLVILFVSTFFSLTTGAVAGFASAVLAWRTPKVTL